MYSYGPSIAMLNYQRVHPENSGAENSFAFFRMELHPRLFRSTSLLENDEFQGNDQ